MIALFAAGIVFLVLKNRSKKGSQNSLHSGTDEEEGLIKATMDTPSNEPGNFPRAPNPPVQEPKPIKFTKLCGRRNVRLRKESSQPGIGVVTPVCCFFRAGSIEWLALVNLAILALELREHHTLCCCLVKSFSTVSNK